MSESLKGTLAVLLAAILWGTTGTVASFAPEFSPFTIGALAMGGGGLLQAWWQSALSGKNGGFLGRSKAFGLLSLWLRLGSYSQ